MTVLEGPLAEYLHVRRQLGFKLKLDGYLLADFVAFLETAGAERITNDLSVTWARRPGANAARCSPAKPSGSSTHGSVSATASRTSRCSRPAAADR